MQQEGNKSDLEKLQKIAVEFGSLEENIIYAHISTDKSSDLGDFTGGMKQLNGSFILIVNRGSVNLTYNFENYTIESPAFVALSPHANFSMYSENDTAFDGYLLGFSQTFLQNVNISFSSINGSILATRPMPVLSLHEKELAQMHRMISLTRHAMAEDGNLNLKKQILYNLVAAMFYQSMLFIHRRVDDINNDTIGLRRSSYVQDFIKLVHLHYKQERGVNFYASKLFISPKYLSLLVKEATGVSAARWIDRFVITEAKNLLRYSGKNIQQVAYALNFPNQSSFGKFFKNITGMSPSEFQKE